MDRSLQQLYDILENKANIGRLVDQMSSSLGVTPFVGAGMSVPYGLKGWTPFLLALGERGGIQEAIRRRLEGAQYEEAAEDLQNALGNLAFHDAVREEYAKDPLPSNPKSTAAELIPSLTDGPVLTTNFDFVLESVFREKGRPFQATLIGPKAESLVEAFHRNQRCLIKLHGTANDRVDRILTAREYVKHYGALSVDNWDWQLPLPRAMRFALTQRPVLFLGCSLVKDRLLAILSAVTHDHPGLGHYAIVEQAEDTVENGKRAHFLSQRGIRPIWYTKGRHFLVRTLLDHVISRVRGPSQDLPSPITVVGNDSASDEPTTLSYAFSKVDQELADKFDKHVRAIARGSRIASIHSLCIDDNSVLPAVQDSKILVFLVSADFLASKFANSEEEMKKALLRHDTNQCRLLPVILRPCLWQNHPLGRVQPAPRAGEPVSSWNNLDQALTNVVGSIELICSELEPKLPATATGPISRAHHKLINVFVKSGTPDLTFVKPENFTRLRLALEIPGRGVIVEGPSGSGKTTAVRKAYELVESSKRRRRQRWLSARKPEDRSFIDTLVRDSADWQTLIIDDFHCLDSPSQLRVVDYMKYLADQVETAPADKKLVILGIPYTHRHIADIAHDVATRIEMFTFSRVSDSLVQQMIEKGEQALNIAFDRKSEIVRAAGGSLNVAQMLCYEIAAQEEILETQGTQRIIRTDLERSISIITESQLAPKYENVISSFVSIGGRKDMTCIELLKEAVQSVGGTLQLNVLRQRRPDLADGIDRLITSDEVGRIHKNHDKANRMFFLDSRSSVFVIDDPQLVFYLKQEPVSKWMKATGKHTTTTYGPRAVIAYCHEDRFWADRLKIHLSPLDKKYYFDYCDPYSVVDESLWRTDTEELFASATAVVLLVSDSFFRESRFVKWPGFHALLQRAKADGKAILTIIVESITVSPKQFRPFLQTEAETLVEMNDQRREAFYMDLASRLDVLLSSDMTEKDQASGA